MASKLGNLMTISQKIYLFSIFLLPIWLTSCQSDDRIDIRDYYFPVEELQEGLVYEYRAVNNDSIGSSYWYYKTVETDTALYFTGNFYEADLTVKQFFRAEIVSNGCLMQDYFLYLTDAEGQQMRFPAEVMAANAFPFAVRDSGGIFLFKLKWTFQQAPLQTTTLIRNRRYIGKKAYRDLDCIGFEVKELVDDFQEGHLEKQYPGEEIYAKGVGLVYYKKEIGDNFVLEYELADTYPMEVLEEKFRIQTEIK